MDPDVRELIERERKAKGLSQEALAEKLGMSAVHYGRILSGARSLRNEHVLALARLLELRPWQLLDKELQPTAADLTGDGLPADAVFQSVEGLVQGFRDAEEPLPDATAFAGMVVAAARSLARSGRIPTAERLAQIIESHITLSEAGKVAETFRTAKTRTSKIRGD